MATLLLSQGTPMICGGDEIGRTQRGNNNAYCQDNELSWFDWELDNERKALLESRSGSSRSVAIIPRSIARSSSAAAVFAAPTCATSCGTGTTAPR